MHKHILTWQQSQRFLGCVPGQHLRVGSGWRHAAVWLAGGIIMAPDINSTRSQRSTDAAAAVWPPNTPDIHSLRAQGDSFPLNYAGGKKTMRDDFHQWKPHCARSTCLQYIKAIFYIKQGWSSHEEVLQLWACCQYLEAGWLFSSSWCFL